MSEPTLTVVDILKIAIPTASALATGAFVVGTTYNDLLALMDTEKASRISADEKIHIKFESEAYHYSEKLQKNSIRSDANAVNSNKNGERISVLESKH